MRALMLAVSALLALPALAQSPAPLSAVPLTGVGSVTPVLSWNPGVANCVASGGWSGTKAASGTQTLPAITVTTAYTLTCPGTTGFTATATWIAPTKNVDGTPLTNLAKYRLYRSGTSTGLGSGTPVEINAPATTHVFSNLPAGPYFFGVKAVNSAGTSSVMSNVATKTFVASAGNVYTVTVTVTAPPIPEAPGDLTVTERTAYDLRRQYFGIFGPYVLNRAVGTVEIGTTCGDDRIVKGGWYAVDRAKVTFTRSARSNTVVALCA